MMIFITPSISVHENELEWHFVRSSGPGGQNVNKVATAVQLRFNIRQSPSIPDDVKDKLVKIAQKRVTSNGVLIVQASRFRTQERNRQDALERFVELIRKASEKPRKRRTTKPSAESKKRRLEQKKQRGEIKRLRRTVPTSED